MEKVLIDLFIVPEAVKADFMRQAERVQQFISTLPGFIEGYIYIQSPETSESRYNVLTTAVWESEEAIENAKAALIRQYQTMGFNPQEALARLGVEKVRATYSRAPY